ncbi:MAG TPA: glycosyltransferase [Candidatus Omnitrophota bacterium]|nr:glycosyltransferase [Candidatus Omnitrophota bacterium]HPD85187.1 glycosyltransferase [Candidatus Omnitrophota bacterium]HRZ04312.1 glycosyltransferase [Candidatus Omnitrophota bacterium]
MKILHLISSGGLFGAENVLLTLAQSMNNERDVSVVGVIRDFHMKEIAVLEKAKELHLPTFILESDGRFDFGAVGRLASYLRKNSIDVLHTHNYKANMLGLIACKIAHKPIMATAHGYTDATQAVSIYEKIDRFVLKRFFPAVVVVSNSVLVGLSDKKKHVIPNGINIKAFVRNRDKGAGVRQQCGIRENEIVIGTVGRLSKEKNQMMLIDAFKELAPKYSQLKLMIVGCGPEERKLKLMAESYRLKDRIIFPGFIADMPPVYQAMDIFVLTSETEGIPLTILEAMASWVPVISTRVGGVPKLIEHEKTGILIEKNNLRVLIAKLTDFVENHAKFKMFAENAFVYVQQNFSSEKMVEQYRKVYQSVVGMK